MQWVPVSFQKRYSPGESIKELMAPLFEVWLRYCKNDLLMFLRPKALNSRSLKHFSEFFLSCYCPLSHCVYFLTNFEVALTLLPFVALLMFDCFMAAILVTFVMVTTRSILSIH